MTLLNLHDVWLGRCPLLGRALYVWVQGCPRRCPGCFNQDTLPFRPAWEREPREVAEECLAVDAALVLSGGEPFAHCAGLVELCDHVRRTRPATPILSYTGYRMEALVARGEDQTNALLARLDVLVDGPYVQAQPVDHPMMGSANQRVIRFATGRVSSEQLDRLERRSQLTTELDRRGRLRVVGSGSASMPLDELSARLRANGVRWG